MFDRSTATVGSDWAIGRFCHAVQVSGTRSFARASVASPGAVEVIRALPTVTAPGGNPTGSVQVGSEYQRASG